MDDINRMTAHRLKVVVELIVRMYRCGPPNEAYTVYAKSGDPLIQTVRNTATHGQQERNSAGEYSLTARREVPVTRSKCLHTLLWLEYCDPL
jgi:hypothetical protein